MIITLCGSTRFKKWFEVIESRLSYLGHVVLNVSSYSHYYNLTLDEDTEHMLETLHKWKISISDAIFVINKNGYIGKSTASEIEFAKLFNKKIYYLEEV